MKVVDNGLAVPEAGAIYHIHLMYCLQQGCIYSGVPVNIIPAVHPKNMTICGIFYNVGAYTVYTPGVYTVYIVN